MIIETTDHGSSLLFARDDYAGIGRRLGILVIDSVVIALMLIPSAMLAIPFAMAGVAEEALGLITSGSWFFGAILYGVVLKSTSLRTLGYRLAGARILDHRGERPSIANMTFRAIWWYAMPANVVVDHLWMLGDPNRQTLCDKFTGLYIVRDRATPLGPAHRQMTLYTLLGYTYAFWEVRPTINSRPARAAQKETGG